MPFDYRNTSFREWTRSGFMDHLHGHRSLVLTPFQDLFFRVLSKCYIDSRKGCSLNVRLTKQKGFKLSEDKKDKLASNWTFPIFTLIWFLNFATSVGEARVASKSRKQNVFAIIFGYIWILFLCNKTKCICKYLEWSFMQQDKMYVHETWTQIFMKTTFLLCFQILLF